MDMYIFIFTAFMIDGNHLNTSKNYFSFKTQEECRLVELKTMKRNDPENCLHQFTPHISNKTNEIKKALASSKDV